MRREAGKAAQGKARFSLDARTTTTDRIEQELFGMARCSSTVFGSLFFLSVRFSCHTKCKCRTDFKIWTEASERNDEKSMVVLGLSLLLMSILKDCCRSLQRTAQENKSVGLINHRSIRRLWNDLQKWISKCGGRFALRFHGHLRLPS